MVPESINMIITMTLTVVQICMILYMFRDNNRFAGNRLIGILYGVLVAAILGFVFFVLRFLMLPNFTAIYSVAQTILSVILFFSYGKIALSRMVFLVFMTTDVLDCFLMFFLMMTGTKSGRLYETYGESGHILMIILIEILVLIFMRSWIREFIHPLIDAKIRMKCWNFLWCIPIMIFAMGRFLLYTDFILQKAKLNGSFISEWVFWSIFVLWIHTALLYLVKESKEKLALEGTLRSKEIQVAAQGEKIKEIKTSVDNARKIKHDMRHHIVTIYHLVKNKNEEEALHYMEKYLDSKEISASLSFCANPVVDALLIFNVHRMQVHDIAYEIDAKLPDDLEVEEDDLCTVMANLIENAVDAASKCEEEEKIVKILVNEKGNGMILIHVSNTFSGELPDINEEEVSSSKGERNGIGLKSVKNIVEKYNGVLSYQEDSGTVTVNVLLGGKTE